MRHKVVLGVDYEARGSALEPHDFSAGLWRMGCDVSARARKLVRRFALAGWPSTALLLPSVLYIQLMTLAASATTKTTRIADYDDDNSHAVPPRTR